MAVRVRAVLPSRWFPVSSEGGPTATPVLDGLLAGLGAGWAAIYSQLAYAKLQTRIATATDVFLDLISGDFFGSELSRHAGEPDGAFRARVQASLLAPKATRAALTAALLDLTGQMPVVFEPAYTHDTGGWGGVADPIAGGGFGYGAGPMLQLVASEPGGWGSLALPFQFFVTACRPLVNGAANVGGYGGKSAPAAGGGFGCGNVSDPAAGGGGLERITLAIAGSLIEDALIESTITATIPAATIAWTHIANAPMSYPTITDESENILMDESSDSLTL
jgi:hypothetical protein